MLVDDNMSNLTSASNEASISSSNRNEIGTLYTQQSFTSPPNNQTTQPPKKKRNLPGNPDPEAEVVALSPRTLLATNRFICEICNKGFQRDQNLQLHKRGHNLPWKLKQRTNKEVKKKVYVCPEPVCVHHDPSRALGDLTGIKKHFCRKHGEKKWKCEKCSKRYAVQSDWKAHSKICGTREYRCDCGTLFSRRDSFITHRAFCDALAEESARAIPTNPLLSSQPGSSTAHLNLQTQLQGHGVGSLQAFSLKREQDTQPSFNFRPEIPPWLASPTVVEAAAGPGLSSSDLSDSQLFSTRFDQSILQHSPNPNPNPNTIPTALSTFQPTATSPHMSATALLQKAAQMGVTMSKPCKSEAIPIPRPHQAHMSETAGSSAAAAAALGLSSREEMRATGIAYDLASFGNKAVVTTGCMELVVATTGIQTTSAANNPSFLPDMMSSFPSTSGLEGATIFEDAFTGMLNPKRDTNFQETLQKSAAEAHWSGNRGGGFGSIGRGGGGGNDSLTRDFLGLKSFPHREFLNIAGLDHMNSSSPYNHESQNQTPWQG